MGKISKREERKRAQREEVLKNWPEQRKMGKKKYVLKFGILNWGITTYVIYWLMMIVVSSIGKTGASYNAVQMLFSLFFFLVFGVFYSLMMWKRNEQMYKDKFPYRK